MRTILFLAVAANSLDLVATALGIHWLGNREGNPLLAGMAHGNWLLFVLVKGVIVPLLIWRLYRARRASPVLASAGLMLVTAALTIAIGQWLGWMAGVVHVASLTGLSRPAPRRARAGRAPAAPAPASRSHRGLPAVPPSA